MTDEEGEIIEFQKERRKTKKKGRKEKKNPLEWKSMNLVIRYFTSMEELTVKC